MKNFFICLNLILVILVLTSCKQDTPVIPNTNHLGYGLLTATVTGDFNMNYISDLVFQQTKDSDDRIDLISNKTMPSIKLSKNNIELFIPKPTSVPAEYQVSTGSKPFACFSNYLQGGTPKEIITYDKNVTGTIKVIKYNKDSIVCTFNFSGESNDLPGNINVTNGSVVYHFSK